MLAYSYHHVHVKHLRVIPTSEKDFNEPLSSSDPSRRTSDLGVQSLLERKLLGTKAQISHVNNDDLALVSVHVIV